MAPGGAAGRASLLTLARRSFVALGLAGVLFGSVVLAAVPTARAEPYLITPGDSLSLIAEQHGISQGVILALNPQLESPDRLFSGRQIDLPDNATYLPALTRISHTVAAGETLTAIASLHQIPIPALLALNPEINPNLLWIGTELLVRDDSAQTIVDPSVSVDLSEPEPETVVLTSVAIGPSIGGLPVQPYRVKSGDTFTQIAQIFGTTIETLLVFNPSIRPHQLFIDATLWVPREPGSLEPTRARRSPDVLVELPTIPYIVIAGDSATEIARRSDLTLEQLGQLNEGVDLSLIFVGQILLIPGQANEILNGVDAGGANNSSRLPSESSEDIDPREFTTYIVRSGDSGYALAATFELELTELASLNPTINFDSLRIGQSLVVPKIDIPPPPPGSVAASAAPANMYRVISGDNLSLIAQRFETSIDTIIKLNPGINSSFLRVDQELKLPGTMPLPIVARTITLDFSDGLEHIAADLGVLPHTLLANNPSLGEWITAGTTLQVPFRDAVLITVQPGDTLLGIAQQFGSSINRLTDDPMTGVISPNQLVIGQQLAIPIVVPEFAWPFQDSIVTDGFGLCRTADCSVIHRGVDFGHNLGSPIGAIADGTVTFVGGSYCCGLGFHVQIAHANGFESLYGHLNGAPPVQVGQTVSRGDIIGYGGSTGFSTGPHLHLELKHNDWFLDALNYLP